MGGCAHSLQNESKGIDDVIIAEGYCKTEAIKGNNRMGCVVGQGRPQRWFVWGGRGSNDMQVPRKTYLILAD